MVVICRKCRASVPEDHAFCTECGAVMAETSAPSQTEADAPEMMATIAGNYSRDMQTVMFAKPLPKPAAEAIEASPSQPSVAPLLTPTKGDDKSGLYIIIGIIIVLLLGSLFIYLLGVILSR